MERWQRRIRVDPNVCGGAPCIVGMRISVSVILDNLAEGLTPDEIAAEYTPLTVDDVRAAIAWRMSAGSAAEHACPGCGLPPVEASPRHPEPAPEHLRRLDPLLGPLPLLLGLRIGEAALLGLHAAAPRTASSSRRDRLRYCEWAGRASKEAGYHV